MKYRNGFVSNSSSSSFLISGKDLEGKAYYHSAIRVINSDTMEFIAKNVEELRKYIDDNYTEQEFIDHVCDGQKTYDLILEKLRMGEHVARGSICDDGSDKMAGFIYGGLTDDPANGITLIKDAYGY